MTDRGLSAQSPHSKSTFPSRIGRLTAVAGTDQRRPIALVLGMHRSGTSLCSHILSAIGVDMAEEIGEHASNPKGHWERREIVEFHNRILALFNRAYMSGFHDLPLPAAFWADPRVAEIKREIGSMGRAGVSYWVDGSRRNQSCKAKCFTV